MNIIVKRNFTSKPEVLFDAFLNPEIARKFMFVTQNSKITEAKIDAKVGGRFLFIDKRDNEEIEHCGEYLILEQSQKIVFSLQVPKYSQEKDMVAIEIRPSESGSELTLHHTLDPKWEEVKDRCKEGWTKILEQMAKILGEDYQKSLFVEKSIEIDAPVAEIWNVLQNPKQNEEWISSWWPGVRAVSDWNQGSKVEWLLADGTVGAQGEVLFKNDDTVQFSFKVKEAPFEKEEKLTYWVRDLGKKSKLAISVGDFADSKEHEACFHGAEEAWNMSLPLIKLLAEKR